MPGVPACLGVFYPQSRVRLTSRSGCLRWISGAGGRPRRSRSACHGHRSHRAMSGPFGPNRREQAGGHRRVLVRSRFLDVSNASHRDNHGHLDPRFGARDQLLLCRSVVWVRGRSLQPTTFLSRITDRSVSRPLQATSDAASFLCPSLSDEALGPKVSVPHAHTLLSLSASRKPSSTSVTYRQLS
eukprot:1992356-Rhodomonas_salina.1